MRCEFCRFSNPPEAIYCQVCNARLPGVVCARCNFQNSPDNSYCGQCGQPLTKETGDQPEPPRGRVSEERTPEDRSTSVVSLILFGAVLAAATVAFPWYLLGDDAAAESAAISVSDQIEVGWSLFPGLPLVLVLASACFSTIIAILSHYRRISPLFSIIPGLVGLTAAIWLWQGLVMDTPRPGDIEFTPMLATIGAIIALVGGALMARPLLSR